MIDETTKPGFTPPATKSAPGADSASATQGAAETPKMADPAPAHSLNVGTMGHADEVDAITSEIRKIGSWISHRLGYHPAHEDAKASLETAVASLRRSKDPSAPATAAGLVTNYGAAPPFNQTAPGATSTSTPGKGPSTEVNV